MTVQLKRFMMLTPDTASSLHETYVEAKDALAKGEPDIQGTVLLSLACSYSEFIACMDSYARYAAFTTASGVVMPVTVGKPTVAHDTFTLVDNVQDVCACTYPVRMTCGDFEYFVSWLESIRCRVERALIT